MAEIRTLKLNLLADVSEFSRGLESSQKKLKRFGKSVDQSFKKTAILAAGLGAAAFKFVEAGEASATANARILQINESMGLFGDQAKGVTDRLVKLAEATALNTGVDQNAIKLTQAKLLTFKELAATADQVGGAFDRATMAAIDMAAAGFGEAESNAVQLGKALNDPIKGITALTRSGITFTAEEKKLIETLVNSGKTLEAQDLILKAIETQVGGTAEATANASDKMRIGFKLVSEQIGTALLPLFEELVSFLQTSVIPQMAGLSDFISRNSEAIKIFAIALVGIVATLGTLSLVIKAVNIVMTTFNAIVKIATIIQAGFNLILSLNPIGLLVIAVAALAAGFVLAYQKIEPFRDLIDSIIQRIKDLGNAIKNSAVGKSLTGIFNSVAGRAAGGSVMGGQAYRVGEFGSELFVPSGSGSIRPDKGGGGNTFIFNGVIDGESARRSKY
jgi:phage-related protein